MKWIKKYENYVGLNVPEYFYHGTNEVFDKFTLDNLGKNHITSILGVYFSEYLFPPLYSTSAAEFAYDAVKKNGGSPVVYKCKINLLNPLIKDSHNAYSSTAFIDINCNSLEKEMVGHDGLIVYNKSSKDYTDYILVTKELDSIEIVKKVILPPGENYFQLRDTIKL